jgi:hypothetical protein
MDESASLCPTPDCGSIYVYLDAQVDIGVGPEEPRSLARRCYPDLNHAQKRGADSAGAWARGGLVGS